jgi:hypothetical protein
MGGSWTAMNRGKHMLIAISGQQITYISRPLHNKNVGQTWQQCENMWQEMKKKCGSRKMQ